MQVNIIHEHILILDENFHNAFCNEIESKMQTTDKEGEKKKDQNIQLNVCGKD